MAALLLSIFGAYAGCTAAIGDGDGTGGQGAAAASGSGGSSAAGGSTSAGGFSTGGGTPTGTGGDCGYAEYTTELEPGLLLIVFDQSCSMVECPDGSTEGCVQCPTDSKWELAAAGMETVLNALPDELRMGLILYPGPGGIGCQAPPAPQVPPGPLSSTRTAILSEFNIVPDGGGTPTRQGLELGYQALSQITDNGNKAVVLVTDGEWNCFNTNIQVFAAAEHAYTQLGFPTFVVGIQEPSAYLSHLAHVGGTDRVPNCNPDIPTPFPPYPTTCEDDPDTCCNYTVGQNVQQELVDALEQVASQLLTNCIFPVPKGDDPNLFDPNLVNVYVDGELVYPDGAEGWTYTGGGTDFIEIHGELCEQLLSGEKEQVVIQLGCPTIPPA